MRRAIVAQKCADQLAQVRKHLSLDQLRRHVADFAHVEEAGAVGISGVEELPHHVKLRECRVVTSSRGACNWQWPPGHEQHKFIKGRFLRRIS